MTILLLKLTITPVVVAAATLAGWRFGPAISGWLIGLPVTVAPVALFLTLEHGRSFGSHVASGSVDGVTGQAAFVIGYVVLARRGAGFWASLALASAAFVAGGLAVEQLGPPIPVALVAGFAAIALGILIVPNDPAVRPRRTFRFDLPVRMAIATILVVGITAAATKLGPGLSGLLTTYPILTTLIAFFAHHSEGGSAAIAVYRGLLAGLFGLAGFAATFGILLPHLHLAVVFALALATTAIIQMSSLRLVRRTGGLSTT